MSRENLDAIEIEVAFVPPIEENQVRVDLFNPVRVGMNHIAPDHHALPVTLGEPLDLVNVFEIETAGTQCLTALCREPSAQIPGFIAIGVEPIRAKEGKVFVVEILEEGQASRVAGGDRPRAFGLRHGLVGGNLEYVFHMTKGLQAGNQVHETLGRVGIQSGQGSGIQGTGIATDRRMFFEAESVLGVEHEYVQFQGDAGVDQFLKAFPGGHLAPGNVQHQTPQAEVGAVLDAAAGNSAPGFNELQQGFNAIAKACWVAGANFDALGSHRELVGVVASPSFSSAARC